MKVDVYSTNGKVVGQLELDDNLYTGDVNQNLLHQVVNAYIQNAKSIKKASTKTRGDVSGSGAKPWKQKGSGRARVGEKRNPLWKKGGIVFGPHPRYVYREIPSKMKLAALKYALRSKIADQQIVVLDALKNESGKTKDFAGILDAFKIVDTRVTFVDAQLDAKVKLSSRNIQRVALVQASDLNAYTALNCKKLIVTKDAVKAIESRITKTS
jgi:large subunit ribosomal protein L4